MRYEHYIGVDLHKAFFQACAVTADGGRMADGAGCADSLRADSFSADLFLADSFRADFSRADLFLLCRLLLATMSILPRSWC